MGRLAIPNFSKFYWMSIEFYGNFNPISGKKWYKYVNSKKIIRENSI